MIISEKKVVNPLIALMSAKGTVSSDDLEMNLIAKEESLRERVGDGVRAMVVAKSIIGVAACFWILHCTPNVCFAQEYEASGMFTINLTWINDRHANITNQFQLHVKNAAWRMDVETIEDKKVKERFMIGTDAGLETYYLRVGTNSISRGVVEYGSVPPGIVYMKYLWGSLIYRQNAEVFSSNIPAIGRVFPLDERGTPNANFTFATEPPYLVNGAAYLDIDLLHKREEPHKKDIELAYTNIAYEAISWLQVGSHKMPQMSRWVKYSADYLGNGQHRLIPKDIITITVTNATLGCKIKEFIPDPRPFKVDVVDYRSNPDPKKANHYLMEGENWLGLEEGKKATGHPEFRHLRRQNETEK